MLKTNHKPRLAFKGFTLSELLVSLGVLGLIAGLTVPSIVVSVDKSKNRSILKEAFQIVSTITNAGVLNGDFDNITSWDFVTDNGAGSISNYISSKLNYSKQCLTSDVTSNGCTTGFPKVLNAGLALPNSTHNRHNARWILPNGAKIQFHRVGTDTTNGNFMVWTMTSKGCATELKSGGTNPDTIVIECRVTENSTVLDNWGLGQHLKPGMCGPFNINGWGYATDFNTVFS